MPKQIRIPNPLRNPLMVLELVIELRLHAGNVEKEAAERGEEHLVRPRVLKIKAFAKELETAANARLGNQLDD